MANKEQQILPRTGFNSESSRREFVAVTAALGLTATGIVKGSQMDVVEEDVEVKTMDGTCDAAFLHPATGSHAAVLIWTDALGLRPSMRQMGKRLAADGYAVLVPNPYYRSSRAPQFPDGTKFDFARDRAQFGVLVAPLQQPGAVESDATAYLAWLDSQKVVDLKKRAGTQGYCTGGPQALRSAAAVADRIGAVGSFHGGALVTDKPDSPHLLASKIKATLYFAIAGSDDQKQPDAKDELRKAFGNRAEIEVYDQDQHGWCVADMPPVEGKPVYNQVDADRAWVKLRALYRKALV
jgi:carboxymethylenebutenolidase